MPTSTMNAIQILESDHRHVEELLAQAEATKNPTERKKLFKEICTELQIHMNAEESVVYPFFSKIESFKQMIEDAYDEHQEAKTILEEASATTSDNELDNKLAELTDALAHHIKDEEEELFPKIRTHLSAAQLDMLTDQLLIAKQNYAARQAA